MDHHQPCAKKGKTLFSFFKKTDKFTTSKHSVRVDEYTTIPIVQHLPNSSLENEHPSSSIPTVQPSTWIEKDPGKRKHISEHPINLQDEIRRAYLQAGPYQPVLLNYPKSIFGNQNRRFQKKWFSQFRWLEYSPSTDKAYCFYCFIFLNDGNPSNSSALMTDGFNNWKRVNQGDKCAFLTHMGSTPSSFHHMCEKRAEDLMRPSGHIDKVMHAITREEVLKNRLQLKTTIRSVQWLALQGCAFRGHDESSSSLNRGNFIEMVKAFAKMNTEIGEVVLDKAPQNAKYTYPNVQKEILHIMANRVRQMIREELGESFFCILVDEAQDESKKEQMAIILRYVNTDGILIERFFAIKSVNDTTSLNLKKEICDVLVRHNLQVQKMRGQGYDGASNMRGTWNGLQALFLKESPYAYYIHCFAYRLQLTLVSAAKDVICIWKFFSHLDSVVNIINSSPKRINVLQTAQRSELEDMLASGERKSGTGANQIGNLQKIGSTRWSSHYESVKSLIDMYAATCKVLEYLIVHSPNGRSRAEVHGVLETITSFEFVFSLHVMHKILGNSDVLCQVLQKRSQDIPVAIRFVSSTKAILQKLREDGWEEFLHQVKTFCSRNDVDIPDLNSFYKIGRSRDKVTLEHHYHFNVFNEAIDFQLMELNTRFNELSVELLSLTVALDPRNSFESFNGDDICKLEEKFYPCDFTEQDIYSLRYELQHYQYDIIPDPRFQVPSLSELCKLLVASRRSKSYIMLSRLIRLVLTLPVSTATTERAFSAMKHVKTTIRNRMEDEFLADCMTLYIEREFVEQIDIDSIIDEFYAVKARRIQLQ